MNYIAPKVLISSFNCPHCWAIAKQDWWTEAWDQKNYSQLEHRQIRVSACQNCNKHTLWVMETMVFPDTGNAPFPNSEMPEDVKILYLEAASIHSKSPRGAAALLRLGIQILCKKLGEKWKNIDDDIACLVKKWLPEIVQQSLDIVRVIGNDAVHPWQIDTDNHETVNNLFNLTNVIVEYMIALPKKVSGIYSQLPAQKIAAIKNRDK